MKRNQRDNRLVIYLDETWANLHCSHERSWVESDDKVQGGQNGKENIEHEKRKAEDNYLEADDLQEASRKIHNMCC